MYEYMKLMLVLDAIRKLGNHAPYPIEGNWKFVEEQLQSLEETKRLSIGSEGYEIALEGKKALLLFDYELAEILKPINVYREVMVDGEMIDGRLPITSYMVKSKPVKEAAHLMHTVNVCIEWENLMKHIVNMQEIGGNWQKEVAEDVFLRKTIRDIDLVAWQNLGSTVAEAARTATWMLNPAQLNKGLVQING